MRLLLLLPSIARIGGVERMVAGLADLLAAEHEVHVAAFDPPGTRPRFGSRAIFHLLGAEVARPLALRWRTYRDQARALGRLKRVLGIDVTISNLWRGDLVSVLSRGPDRKVALAHINVVGNATNERMMRLRPVVAAAYRRFDRVVTVSEGLRDELTRLYRLDRTRVAAIANFTSIAKVVPTPAPPARVRLVWCGRFVAEKGVLALVEIFARLLALNPGLQLVMIGDGPLLEEVRSEFAAHGLPAVASPAADAPLVLTGASDDPFPLIASAALLLLPSFDEGLPMVLLESLALGTPVAGADCAGGGVRQALGGLAPHDPARSSAEAAAGGVVLPVPATAAAIDLWVATIAALLDDPARLAELRKTSRERAASFSPAAAADRWRALLAELAPA